MPTEDDVRARWKRAEQFGNEILNLIGAQYGLEGDVALGTLRAAVILAKATKCERDDLLMVVGQIYDALTVTRLSDTRTGFAAMALPVDLPPSEDAS